MTTPKLPPPPRNAQNSSGCSSAEARIGSPLAVISDGEVVAGEAVLALEPAGAAAEREPGDAGARHAAADGEAVLLGSAVDLGPRRAAADAHDPAHRVDDDLAEAADVDHEAVLDEREAGHRVAAAAHGGSEVAHPREGERGGDLVRVRAARDVALAGVSIIR